MFWTPQSFHSYLRIITWTSFSHLFNCNHLIGVQDHFFFFHFICYLILLFIHYIYFDSSSFLHVLSFFSPLFLPSLRHFRFYLFHFQNQEETEFWLYFGRNSSLPSSIWTPLQVKQAENLAPPEWPADLALVHTRLLFAGLLGNPLFNGSASFWSLDSEEIPNFSLPRSCLEVPRKPAVDHFCLFMLLPQSSFQNDAFHFQMFCSDTLDNCEPHKTLSSSKCPTESEAKAVFESNISFLWGHASSFWFPTVTSD